MPISPFDLRPSTLIRHSNFVIRISPISILQPRFHPFVSFVLFVVKLPRMDAKELTLAAFQQHIRDRYEAVDRARGTPRTWMWFIEEVGELSHALAKADDRPNLEEEFADVLAWLCTLANINDVDLAKVLIEKYLSDKPPEGHK